MNTDQNVMKNNDKFIYKDLTYEIIGALYAVHNELGPVHKEKIYHHAIKVEFGERSIKYVDEKGLDVMYRNKRVGMYQPDFIIEDKVILEIKAVPILTKTMVDQMFYYVKGTEYRLALLVNFGTKKLSIKRRIY